MTASLAVERVQAGYHGLPVLQGISLEVPTERIVGVVGPNGAGKSTLLRTISGLLKPTEGSISIDGEQIDGRRPDQIVRAGIVHVPEGRQVFPNMTVEENLLLGAYTRRELPPVDEMYERFPRLRERRRLLGSSLSGGEQSMLAIARGLMARPRILMLDEPTLGLSPIATDGVRETLRELNASGLTILIVEQNVALAMALSHTIHVVERGRLVYSGTAEQLEASGDLASLYLGGATRA